MKVVICKNCGAKYQLDDADDINSFECSICTGSLEKLDGSDNTDSQSINSDDYDDSYNQNCEFDSVIVCCQNCGLKFKLNKTDDIRDFECVSCDGSLRYLDDKLNELYGLSSLSEVVEDSNHEVEILEDNESIASSIFNSSSSTEAPINEIVVEHDTEPNFGNGAEDTIKEPNREVEIINGFNNVEEPSIEGKEVAPKTLERKPLFQEDYDRITKSKNALTFNSVEEYEQYKLALFKTYDVLNEYLKREYIVDLDKQVYNNRSNSSVVNPKIEYSQMSYKNYVKSQNQSSSNMYLVPIIVGVILVIGEISLFILLKSWITLVLIVLGIILIVLGIISKVNKTEKEVRNRIIREKLEQLPDDFYLFYFTKPPCAKDGLNHVIVGPTGLYTILTQKYSSKEDKNKQKSDVEVDELISGPSDIKNYMDNRNRLELTDGYDDHQTRFQFGNEEIQFDYNSKIKHKSLTLNEDLAIFLDKNGLSGVYIEPLIGFINDDVVIINVVLTNEDLFLEELLYKIANGPRRLDSLSVIKIAKLLSKYSVNCAIEN